MASNDDVLSSDEIRDMRRLYKLFGGGLRKVAAAANNNRSSSRGGGGGGGGLRTLYDFFRALEDAERDYLTPHESMVCVTAILFYGASLASLYKLYSLISSEEERVREHIRRFNNSSG